MSKRYIFTLLKNPKLRINLQQKKIMCLDETLGTNAFWETYIWDEANLIQMVAELRVMEGNHLGEDGQILCSTDKRAKGSIHQPLLARFLTVYNPL